MFFLKTSTSVFLLLNMMMLGNLVLSSNQEQDIKTGNSNRKTNLAEDLLNIAKESDYNLTLEDIDMAQSASTDAEVSEALPLPVAEKLIGHRRRNDLDILREQMIGMIFTGEPRPLGSRTNKQENRRHIRTRPKQPAGRHEHPFQGLEEEPREILKPMSFVPRGSNVEFPIPPVSSSEPNSRGSSAIFKTRDRVHPHPHFEADSRPARRPESNVQHGQYSTHKLSIREDFSNSLGPDFGPVTFEEFGPGGAPYRENIDPPQRSKDTVNPKLVSSKNPFRFSNLKFGEPPVLPPKFPETSGLIPHFGEIAEKPNDRQLPFGGSFIDKEGCYRYTEDICLDTDLYPHEEILSSLTNDPLQARTLMAEVKEQSADELVDGVTAAEESRYDFSHYFGNRRQSTANHVHRDFAGEGGYLCPSEVKYARPKKARNSKGEWKFVVNMDKYTQTIRMEKCMKPGGTCSYVSHHYRATCSQIYNYQRLLSWEKSRELHMDIFKVPSCCSCHIQGYAYVFPPLHKSDASNAASERIDHFLSGSDNLEEINKHAPPYSPVNYPNVKVIEEERTADYTPGSRIREVDQSSDQIRVQQRAPIRRSSVSESRVNYGYHPIIDFFDNSKN